MGSAVSMLIAELPALLVLVATALLLWGERRVHSYNYAYLKAIEGEELIPKQMRHYHIWISMLPWAAFLTSFLLPSAFKLSPLPLLGLSFIMAGCGLKFGAIRSLGRLWSARCIFVPGMPRVGHGPYRFLRHPEYLGRSLETWGLLCFFGLNPLGFLLWIYSISLLSKIVKTESRQLYELSVAPLQLPQRSSTVGTSE